MGLVNFYRSFLGSDISTVLEPLTRLLKGVKSANARSNRKIQLKWTDEQQVAFEELKSRVAQNTVLEMPDWKKPFGLATDASSVGIGAVLFQTSDDGIERPVAFFSRVLNDAERNYSTTDRELLAIVAATDHFRHYIYGRHCKVFTDHSALQYLNNAPREQVGRNGRWLARLGDYDLSFAYRPGKANGNADACSRLPVAQQQAIPFAHEQRAQGPYLVALGVLRPRVPKSYKALAEGRPQRDDADAEAPRRSKRPRKQKASTDDVKAVGPNDQARPLAPQPQGEHAELSATPVPQQDEVPAPQDASTPGHPKRLRRDAPSLEAIKHTTPLDQEVREAQRHDAYIQKMLRLLDARGKEGDLARKNYRAENKVLLRKADSIRRDAKDLIVVPSGGKRTTKKDTSDVRAQQAKIEQRAKELRTKIIRECHDRAIAGHLGIAKTVQRVRESFWWRGLERDVAVYVRTCVPCNAGKSPKKKPAGKMVITPPPSEPFEEVGVDFIGPITPSTNGYKYVCCVTDLFTGYVTAWPARDAKARTFAEDFITHMVIPGNTPRAIRHDRGRTFENATVRHLLYVLYVRDIHSSGYHPQFNGAVERTNGQFAQLMRTMPEYRRKNWPSEVPMFAASINSSVCSVRGDTPFFLTHGRDFRTVLSVAAGSLIAAPKRDLSEYRVALLK